MKKHIIFLFTAVTAMVAAEARASMTIEEYLKVERGEMENIDSALNIVYVWGVMDALGVFDDALRENLGQTLFCVPEGAQSLLVEDFKVEIDKLIEKAQAEALDFDAFSQQMTIGGLGLQVLSRIYSCREN